MGEDSARQPYCHTVLGVCVGFFPFSRRGKRCPFFIFCLLSLVQRLLPFFLAVLLFLGSLFGKIIGSELLFLGVGFGLVFFCGVLLRFLLYVLAACSRNCLEKFS